MVSALFTLMLAAVRLSEHHLEGTLPLGLDVTEVDIAQRQTTLPTPFLLSCCSLRLA